MEAFLAPVGISDDTVLVALRAICAELVASVTGNSKTAPFFQRKNSRSLIRRIQVISVLLDALRDVGLGKTSSTVFLCLKELYILLYRSRILIEYVNRCSKLWLLLQNHYISGHFHDLNLEISTVLDVFPLSEINLSKDVKEQVELLRNQSRKFKVFIDKHDELLRLELHRCLDEFESGRIPKRIELHCLFVENLGICNGKSCRDEIEFLEEQIVNHDRDLEPAASMLNGFVAVIRYCRFLLFEFGNDEDEDQLRILNSTMMKKGLITQGIADAFVAIPKDFCCPISLDLMKDPVIVSTGQTYDRASITRWMQGGHCTCPKSGQMFVNSKLVPNRALRNLMKQWCLANGISYDLPEHSDYSSERTMATLMSKAAIRATKATACLLGEKLSNGTLITKCVVAREIRLLAKAGRAYQACIAEANVIPLLTRLLLSADAATQENSVTAMLNLSIHEKNKSLIMDVEGCLGQIVGVLSYGHTKEARENAAATLFSLSAVHDYKKQIAQEDGAVTALVRLMGEGTPRGKKDAVTALLNLCTHTENCARLNQSGAITALVGALGHEGISEAAAGALALIVRQPLGAAAVANEDMAVSGLIAMIQYGTPRGKENAVAVLLELCRSCGAATTERVVKAPGLAGLLQSLLFTGTKRAQRKAASLARVFQRCDNAISLHFGRLGAGYSFALNSAVAMDTSFDSDATLPVISVPVLL